MWTRNLAILQQLMQQQWEAARSLSQELMATGNVKTVKMLISLGGELCHDHTFSVVTRGSFLKCQTGILDHRLQIG